MDEKFLVHILYENESTFFEFLVHLSRTKQFFTNRRWNSIVPMGSLFLLTHAYESASNISEIYVPSVITRSLMIALFGLFFCWLNRTWNVDKQNKNKNTKKTQQQSKTEQKLKNTEIPFIFFHATQTKWKTHVYSVSVFIICMWLHVSLLFQFSIKFTSFIKPFVCT